MFNFFREQGEKTLKGFNLEVETYLDGLNREGYYFVWFWHSILNFKSDHTKDISVHLAKSSFWDGSLW